MKLITGLLLLTLSLSSYAANGGAGDMGNPNWKRSSSNGAGEMGGGVGSPKGGVSDLRGVMDGAGEMRSGCHYHQKFSICK